MLNWNYSEVFVPHFTVLQWTAYKKSTFNNSYVWPFNNAYRRVLSLPWRSSARTMYANLDIQNFEAVLESLLLDHYNDWPKALIIWLWNVHGLYASIYGISCKKKTLYITPAT